MNQFDDETMMAGLVPQPNIEDQLSDATGFQPSGLDSKLRYQELLDTYRQMKPAQEQANQNRQNIGLLAAGNQIAKGIAMGSGAKIDDGSDAIRSLQQQADAPVKAIQQKLDTAKDAMQTAKLAAGNDEAEKMADPNSDVSKLYREFAYNTLGKINPELQGKLDNMSAAQLMKLPGMKDAGKAGASGTAIGFGQFVNAKGEPLVMTRDNKIMNLVTQREHNASEGVARPIGYTNPMTGNREYMGAGFSTQLGGGFGSMPQATMDAQGNMTPAPKPTVGDYRRANIITPEEIKTIDKDKEGFEMAMKPQLTIAASLESVPTLANQALTNPNAAASLGGIIGAMFEPGKLTDEDALRYVRESGIENQLKNFMNEKASGTIRKETAQNIAKTANNLKLQLQQIVRRKAVQMASSANQRLLRGREVDPEVVADYYYDKSNIQSPSGDIIKVKGPSGQTTNMKKSVFEQKYKSKPGYEIVK